MIFSRNSNSMKPILFLNQISFGWQTKCNRINRVITQPTGLWDFTSQNTLETGMLARRNASASPAQIRSLVSVEGNKSLPLICSPAAVLSAGCYLGALLNLSTVWATWALSVSVLLEKDPWPPGLHRPWIDLSLVLLFQLAHVSPWVLSISLSLTLTLFLCLAPNVMVHLGKLKASLCNLLPEKENTLPKEKMKSWI